jgi:DNA-binding GntR family transcriptional regulator
MQGGFSMSLGRAKRAKPKEHANTRTYQLLKALAIEYRFRPGEQLLINEIAEHLCVSPTPVRECLIRLQTEELLDTSPRRGFFSKTLDMDEMVQLFEMRFVVLKGAVELWLEELRDTARDRLTPVIDFVGSQCQCCGASAEREHATYDPINPTKFVEAMGERIATVSTNAAMKKIMENANDRTHYMRLIDFESPARAHVVVENMKELTHALQQRKGALAIRVLKSDLEEQIERMDLLVKEGICRSHSRPRWYTSLQMV